jgi:hypothetical protein
MSSVGIRDELYNMKMKMETLEEELSKQLVEAEEKYKKWNEIDKEVDEMRQNAFDIITINVGGKTFQTKIDTLLSIKDTLFYKIIVSKKLDLMDPIFIDRNYKFFKYIMTFLRYQKINLNELSRLDLDDLLEEATFYEMDALVQFISENTKEIRFKRFEFSGLYNSGFITAGTNNIEHINNYEDRSATNGICANSPGWIILELEFEVEFSKIEIAGWNGNPSIWASSNGSEAAIKTSLDKSNWITVGNIPSNYSGAITTLELQTSHAKYIKFDHNSYLGIGYCRLLQS